MKKVLFFGICTIILLSTAAPHAQAYTVTGARATKVNDTTTLFTINFKIGFLNRATGVPIAANSQYPRDLSYEVVDSTGTKITTGLTTGLVMSSSTITNGRYRVAEGKNGHFSLVVLHTHPAHVAQSLRITELPFTMYDGSLIVGASVPKENLAAFVTPYTK